MLSINLNNLTVRFAFYPQLLLAAFSSMGKKRSISIYVSFYSGLLCPHMPFLHWWHQHSRNPSSSTPPSHIHVQPVTNPDNSITHMASISTPSCPSPCISSIQVETIMAGGSRRKAFWEWPMETREQVEGGAGGGCSFGNWWRWNFPEVGTSYFKSLNVTNVR